MPYMLMDIRDTDLVGNVLKSVKSHVVSHFAAYTAVDFAANQGQAEDNLYGECDRNEKYC